MKNTIALRLLQFLSQLSLVALILTFLYILSLTIGHSFFSLSDKWHTSLELPIHIEHVEQHFPVTDISQNNYIKEIEIQKAALEIIPIKNASWWQVCINLYALIYILLLLNLVYLFYQCIIKLKTDEPFGELLVSNMHKASMTCMVLSLIPIIPQAAIFYNFAQGLSIGNGNIKEMSIFTGLNLEYLMASLILLVLGQLFKEAKELSDLEKLTV